MRGITGELTYDARFLIDKYKPYGWLYSINFFEAIFLNPNTQNYDLPTNTNHI